MEPSAAGKSIVKVNDVKIDYEKGYSYPNNDTVYDLK